jgi:hypothetical protein
MDISKLCISELAELNKKVIERIRFLQQVEAHEAMLDFHLGQAVTFESEHGLVTGLLTKFNKKTVNVVSTDGREWRVAPQLLSQAEMKDVTPLKSNVIGISGAVRK